MSSHNSPAAKLLQTGSSLWWGSSWCTQNDAHLARVGGQARGEGVEAGQVGRREEAHVLAAPHLSQQVVVGVGVGWRHLQHVCSCESSLCTACCYWSGSTGSRVKVTSCLQAGRQAIAATIQA